MLTRLTNECPNRYSEVRMRSTWLGGKWVAVSRPVRNVAKSILLKHCTIKLNGLGKHECQVQACDDKYVWVCPIDPLVLRSGCLKFKRRMIEIAVRTHYYHTRTRYNYSHTSTIICYAGC